MIKLVMNTPTIPDLYPGFQLRFISVYFIFRAANAASYQKEEVQRKMERWCIDREGFVALYAETFLTRAEFTKMFDVQLKYYDELRKEYGLEGAFPKSYDKISTTAREDDENKSLDIVDYKYIQNRSNNNK